MRRFLLMFAGPTLALAQAAFPTEWPIGAESLAPDALRQRLIGNSFVAKSVTGPDVRTQYKESYVYINVGNTSDSGEWRTEGSAVCVEWKQLRPSCSEIRLVGDLLYVKRANNGEVMALTRR